MKCFLKISVLQEQHIIVTITVTIMFTYKANTKHLFCLIHIHLVKLATAQYTQQ